MSQKQWFQIKALSNGNAEIFIFDEIGYWGIRAKEFIQSLKDSGANKDIDLHINSPGGDVFDGIAIYNMLKNHSGKVTVYIDGLAASMASVIAMAGDEIIMPDNALMMIHNPWGYAQGDADEMRKTADTLDKVKEALLSAYHDKTGIDREELAALLTSETWLTGAEAKEKGFADTIVEPVDLAASFDLTKLTNFQNSQSEKFKQSTFVGATSTVKTGESDMGPKDKQTPVKETGNPDISAAVKDGVEKFKAQELDRKTSIRSAFGDFSKSHGKLLNTCLDDMECTVDIARQKLLNEMGKNQTPQEGGFAAKVNVGNGAIVADSMGAAIKNRAGIKLADGELTKDNPFRAMTLLDMARASLTEKGVGVASFGDRLSLVAAAFTHSTSDFGSVLADVAHKAVLLGYDESEETFQKWTRAGQLSDFKVSNRVGLDSFPSLDKVAEGGEYKYATFGERAETIVLATYGKLFSITRQGIINDDLDMFTRIPQIMGRAAIRTIGDLVYAIVNDNPKMADSKALFHTGHANIASGGGSALSETSLTSGRTAMRLQKDSTGSVLNIRPSYLLVPAALETQAEILMSSMYKVGGTNNEPNAVAGMAEVVTEPRLDANSSKSWYLTAGQNFDTVEVAYLDGNQAPRLEQQAGWSVDGVEFKVAIDAGVSPLEHRTMYKGVGE